MEERPGDLDRRVWRFEVMGPVGPTERVFCLSVDDGGDVLEGLGKRSGVGLDDAIARARAYGEAGADVLFVEAPRTREELARVGSELHGWPLMANMVEFGKTPLLAVPELKELGFSLVIFPGSITRIATRAARELLHEIAASGTTAGALGRMASFQDVNEVVGLTESNEWEQGIADRAAE